MIKTHFLYTALWLSLILSHDFNTPLKLKDASQKFLFSSLTQALSLSTLHKPKVAQTPYRLMILTLLCWMICIVIVLIETVFDDLAELVLSRAHKLLHHYKTLVFRLTSRCALKINVLKLGLAEHALKTNIPLVHNRLVPITILLQKERPFLLDATIRLLEFSENPQLNTYDYKECFTFFDDILKQKFLEKNNLISKLNNLTQITLVQILYYKLSTRVRYFPTRTS